MLHKVVQFPKRAKALHLTKLDNDKKLAFLLYDVDDIVVMDVDTYKMQKVGCCK